MVHTLFIVFILAFLTGCNLLRPEPNPVLDNNALALATRAASFNSHIHASKGTGWITLKTGNRTDRFKIAWAAAYPGKIRITFLLSGHPVETIISTGQQVRFISHNGDHSLHTVNSKNLDMENYIKIPVKLSEIILMLLGRFPVKTFDDVYFSPDDPTLSTVILWENWKGVAQYLKVDKQGRLTGIKKNDFNGLLLYDMTIIDYKTILKDTIASKVHLIDAQNRTMTLTIKSFKANPVIKESVFRLTAKRS